MRPLRSGENPRDLFPSHRERGPQRFEYTYEEAARIFGVQVDRAKQIIGHAPGATHLEQVANAIVSRRRGAAAVVQDHELEEAFGNEYDAALWRNRWPRLNLYKCSASACKCWTLCTPGYCAEHRGGTEAIRLSRRSPGMSIGYMEMHTGNSYQPLHRIIHPVPKGIHVHHVDFNRFNNRPDNLQAVSQEMHRMIHAAESVNPERRAHWLKKIEELAAAEAAGGVE